MANFKAIDIGMQNMSETKDNEFRRGLLAKKINAHPKDYETLVEEYGEVWTNEEFKEQFERVSFLAPFVMATHRETKAERLLMFQHHPRFYFVLERETVNPLIAWLGNESPAREPEEKKEIITRKVQEDFGQVTKPRFR